MTDLAGLYAITPDGLPRADLLARVEAALVGTAIPHPDLKYTIAGRIIRSFDPCISCATH